MLLFQNLVVIGICLRQVVLAAPSSSTCAATKAIRPLTGGPTELPATNLELVSVAVGRGVQNYTCGAGWGAACIDRSCGPSLRYISRRPQPFFKLTSRDGISLAKFNPDVLHAIPANAVYRPAPKSGVALFGLPYLGSHFFDASSTPVFLLTEGRKPLSFFGLKVDGIAAPKTAEKGPAGTGAVDWLFLHAKKTDGYDGRSVGIKQVYRVVTAGGAGGTCLEPGIRSVEYATEYWFYK